MADNTNNQPQLPFLLQKYNFPKGIIDPLMLASTAIVAKGDLYYSSGTNFVRLPITNNAALTSVAGIPVWQVGYSGTITTAKLTTMGANGSMTFINGILTAQVAAT